MSSTIQSVVVETRNPEDSPRLAKTAKYKRVLDVVKRDAARPDHILTKGCFDRDYYSLPSGVARMGVESADSVRE